jgi:hypothetical protein
MISQDIKGNTIDVEATSDDLHLRNDTINTLFWEKVTVKVHDRSLGKEKCLLHSINGDASAGQYSLQISSYIANWEPFARD